MNSIHDPSELEKIIAAASTEANLELANSPRHNEDGFCHLFWATKKRILKQKYGVDWQTPAERNPDTRYD